MGDTYDVFNGIKTRYFDAYGCIIIQLLQNENETGERAKVKLKPTKKLNRRLSARNQEREKTLANYSKNNKKPKSNLAFSQRKGLSTFKKRQDITAAPVGILICAPTAQPRSMTNDVNYTARTLLYSV